jgi:ferric-dicitrate binding protein FerR (iron transport regulator)
MDFGIIALVVVGAGKLLDYVAPRTKTTVDDKVRGAFQWALGFLPFVNKRLADEVGKAQSEPPVVVASQVEGFGTARDHRK